MSSDNFLHPVELINNQYSNIFFKEEIIFSVCTGNFFCLPHV